MLQASRFDDAPRLCGFLAGLYRRQCVVRPDDLYLAAHARPHVVATQVRVFDFYTRFLPADGTVLDWGCRHAPDACLLRARYGQVYALHGCDFPAREEYAVFHENAGLDYRRLDDPVRLPYADAAFDVVIASGTLEHVAMDYESLKQLYRVLRPGGQLIITYLPNRWSYEEWWMRRSGRPDFHRRLYGLTETVRLLKHTGFYPWHAAPQSFFWERRFGPLATRRWGQPVVAALKALIPVQRFCSTHCLIAEKVDCM